MPEYNLLKTYPKAKRDIKERSKGKTDEIIKICKNYGILVTVYSSQNIEKNEAEELWNLGVDSIFIDNPISYKNMLE